MTKPPEDNISSLKLVQRKEEAQPKIRVEFNTQQKYPLNEKLKNALAENKKLTNFLPVGIIKESLISEKERRSISQMET